MRGTNPFLFVYFCPRPPFLAAMMHTPIADDIAPPAVPGGRGYFPVGDEKYAALTEGKSCTLENTNNTWKKCVL